MGDDLPALGPEGKWWIGLVTFEKEGDAKSILTKHDHGAAGWMAAFAQNEDELADTIRATLSEIGLKFISVEQPRIVETEYDIEEVDDHLAENFRHLEQGKSVIWGTLHAYLADGEA